MLKILVLAVLIATADADSMPPNDSEFWYPAMDHSQTSRGYASVVGTEYEVMMSASPRDSASIQRSIDYASPSEKRNKGWPVSMPRVVFIPSGVYEIDRTIFMETDTVLMGDGKNPPIIKPSKYFEDDVLVNGQAPSSNDKGENSFAIALKNLILDTTDIDGGKNVTALYWGVAQASHLQNVRIRMPKPENGKGHSGIVLGRGSALTLADVHIQGGQNGIWHQGHQQALYKSIYFHENAVGLLITGGYTVTLLASTFDNVQVAVQNLGGKPFVGILDGKSINSGITLVSHSASSIHIHNLESDGTSDIVEIDGQVILTARNTVNSFSYGNTVDRNPVRGVTDGSNRLSAKSTVNSRIPVMEVPNYSDRKHWQVVNVKEYDQNGGYVVKGDGKTDDVKALNRVLKKLARSDKVAYFPYGEYRVSRTLKIPPGALVVGEAWATIAGFGDYFKDPSSPKPVVQIGKRRRKHGQKSTVHVQDMRFTVAEPLPGAILVQFRGGSGRPPGNIALVNSIITVGGVAGSPKMDSNCTDPADPCRAAYMGMHFMRRSSAYVENVWNWVADHMAEHAANSTGYSIAAKAGVLIESRSGTWIHGLGSEHWWLYQLAMNRARHVVVTMLQTETNYEQGDRALALAPYPWPPDGRTDPDFRWCAPDDGRCRMGLATYVRGGRDIAVFGAASWAFFSGPGRAPCDGPFACQDVMHWIDGAPRRLQMYGMCSKDTWNALRLANGTSIRAVGEFEGGWSPGAVIGRYVT